MLKHFFIFAVYTMLAVAVALVAPRVLPNAGPGVGWMVGAMVLIAAALFHEISVRLEQMASLQGRMEGISLELRCIAERANGANDEIRRVERGVEALAEGGESRAKKDLDRVVSEVRVLQNLIEQVSKREPAQGEKPPPRKAPVTKPTAATAVRESLDDAEVLEIVREGLRRDRVDLYLQPVVSLPQRKTRFYECFSRIRDDRDAVILPDQYMEVAKREGHMAAIDNLLLFRCVQLVRRAQSRNQKVGFFCNISANTLEDRDFFSDFVGFMGENRELANNLIFEFSHSDFETHISQVDEYIGRLGGYGFFFSLDHVDDLAKLDIEALAQRRFRFIKIKAETLLEGGETAMADREAVAAGAESIHGADGGAPAAQEGGDRLIRVNVPLLKRAMDRYEIDLIVEKIEREPDLLELLDHHIDYGQGYLFGEPRISREG